MFTSDLFESSNPSIGLQVFNQLIKSVDRNTGCDLRIGIEVKNITAQEARYLLGKYRAINKDDKEAGLAFLSDVRSIEDCLECIDDKTHATNQPHFVNADKYAEPSNYQVRETDRTNMPIGSPKSFASHEEAVAYAESQAQANPKHKFVVYHVAFDMNDTGISADVDEDRLNTEIYSVLIQNTKTGGKRTVQMRVKDGSPEARAVEFLQANEIVKRITPKEGVLNAIDEAVEVPLNLKKGIIPSEPIAEAEEVQVPHNGKMVSGRIVRFDKGNPESPFYVVDIGEYGSIKVPAHRVKKLDEAGAQVDPIILKALERLKPGLKGSGPGSALYSAAKEALALEYGLMRARSDSVFVQYLNQLQDLYTKRQSVNESSKTATAKEVLDYVNNTHHESFKPGEKMYDAIMVHPEWELRKVSLMNLNIPDQEYDDVDYDEYEPESDSYGRSMLVDPDHAGKISQSDINKNPIVIDHDRYIIDGNHRAWAAKHLFNQQYINAWMPVKQLTNSYVNEGWSDRDRDAYSVYIDGKEWLSKDKNGRQLTDGLARHIANKTQEKFDREGIKKSVTFAPSGLKESVGVTDYNPPSQGGTRKELLAKYAKTGSSKDAEAARRAGASQMELKAAHPGRDVDESAYGPDEKLADVSKIDTKTLQSMHALHKHYGQTNSRNAESAKRAADELLKRGVRVSEGAIDDLEQRRIDDLNNKMDELVARAGKMAKSNPESAKLLMQQYQVAKAERDSYYKIKDNLDEGWIDWDKFKEVSKEYQKLNAEQQKAFQDKQMDDRLDRMVKPGPMSDARIGLDEAVIGGGRMQRVFHNGKWVDPKTLNQPVKEDSPFKSRLDAIGYAKSKVKTHRDPFDGIEIWQTKDGFDVNHTMNANGRNWLKDNGAKHITTVYPNKLDTDSNKVKESYTADTNYKYIVVVDGEEHGVYTSAEEAKDVVRKLRTQSPGHNFLIKKRPLTSTRSVKRFVRNRDMDEAVIGGGGMQRVFHNGKWVDPKTLPPGTVKEDQKKNSEIVPRNFVAKNMQQSGQGKHKDWKRAQKQGDFKHKRDAIPMDESVRAEVAVLEEKLAENLHKWFKEKWVRFNPQGKIMGPCARGSSKEGKPKCLPQAKAHSLGKKKRASAAAKKRREDPNPDRKGKAKNVATKVREDELSEKWSEKYKRSIDCNNPKGFSQKAHCASVKNEESVEHLDEKGAGLWANIRAKQKRIKAGSGERMRKPGSKGAPSDAEIKSIRTASNESIESVEEACWKGYHKEGTKKLFGKTVPNCVKNESETHELCPECGGSMFPEEMINEKKDACYYKVKSRYKVWPSAYASGALVKCRKAGAKNWGNKTKKESATNEARGINLNEGEEDGLASTIFRRILAKHRDVLSRHSPEAVLGAAREEAIMSDTDDIDVLAAKTINTLDHEMHNSRDFAEGDYDAPNTWKEIKKKAWHTNYYGGLDEEWKRTDKTGTHIETGKSTREYIDVDDEGRPTGDREWRDEAGNKMDEAATGIGRRVKVVRGPEDVVGKIGRVGEIRPGRFNGDTRIYTVDFEDGTSIQLRGTSLRQIKDTVSEDVTELRPGQYYVWTAHFDDGTSSKVKVTDADFNAKDFYAKKGKNVINVDYDWTVHGTEDKSASDGASKKLSQADKVVQKDDANENL